MSEIRIPLPNGTQLTFVQKEQVDQPQIQKIADAQDNEPTEEIEAIQETTTQPADEVPLMVASVNELQEISLALIYYKTYLKNKGQKDRAEQIGAIDHKIFQTLQNAQAG